MKNKNEEDEKKISEKNIYQLDYSKFQPFIEETVIYHNKEIKKLELS
jgi:hypothetical protein